MLASRCWKLAFQQLTHAGTGQQTGSQATGVQTGTYRQVLYFTQYGCIEQVVTGTCRVQHCGSQRQVV